MSARSSQSPLKAPWLSLIVLLALIVASGASMAFGVEKSPTGVAALHWSGWNQLPAASHPSVVERADLFPVHVEWPGEGPVAVPGIYHTRRMTVDAATSRPVRIELALAEPMIVHRHATSGSPPRIALTFDDGPHETYTPQILDVLGEHGGRCTLFTLGALVSSHRQLLQRAEERGHEIGIHSWWHANYTGLSSAEIQADIRRCENALESVARRPVRWVRPPYGAVNSRVRQAIGDAGYHIAMWSVDPLDWRSPGSDAIASHILSRASDGAVVLLHDGGGNRAGTVAAVRKVVPELRRRGFELVTLSELTGLAEPAPMARGMRLMVEGRVFEVDADFDDVRVTVDGIELDLPEPPAMIDGRFLVPARPVLDALGAPVRWDADSLAVSFRGVRGEFVVKLNTLDVTLGGDSVIVKIPSIYYHGVAMLPVWLMANACEASVRWNAEERTIEFTRASITQVRMPRPGMITLRRHDGSRITWWPRSSLMSLLPEGEEFAAI